MTRDEKEQMIKAITEDIKSTSVFYLADTSELNAATTVDLRRECHKNNVKLRVVKNTLLRRAVQNIDDRDYSGLLDSIKGPTSIMLSDTGNAPAKIIEKFRKKNDRPLLKGAWVDEAVFIGDDQIAILSNLKSKEELVGDIITLLQSPMMNVISALKSGQNTIGGLVKALQERAA